MKVTGTELDNIYEELNTPKEKREKDSYTVFDPILCGEICPICGASLRTKWSGVECTKCAYWFCY